MEKLDKTLTKIYLIVVLYNLNTGTMAAAPATLRKVPLPAALPRRPAAAIPAA